VDNDSENGSVSMIHERFPQLRIIRSPRNVGYAAGHRIVADIALKEDAALLWILNNDVTVRTDTFRN